MTDYFVVYRDPETLASSSYLVVQSPSDKNLLANVERPQKGSHSLVRVVSLIDCNFHNSESSNTKRD